MKTWKILRNAGRPAVIALALLVTSCARSPHLAGDWQMGGPDNVGQTCHVLQDGADLTFVNEKGDKSDGVLIAKRSAVLAMDWEGGLMGELTNNGTRINWRNGSWWTKAK